MNVNDEQLVMESFSPVLETVEMVETTKSVSKSLTMKEKRAKSSIIGFLALAVKEGLLDESKWKGLMDFLPLLKLVKDQKEFFSNECFEVKEVEVEVLKPYLAERKAEIKAEKKVSKKEKVVKEKVVKEKVVKEKVVKEGGEKPKRQRKPKKVISREIETFGTVVEPVPVSVVETLPVVEPLSVEEETVSVSVPVVLEKKEKVKKAKKEDEEGKKRGRKAKVSIVECKQDEVNEDVVSEEDQMVELLKNRLKDKEAEEIDISDLENVLNDLEEEEEGRSTPILEEKKEKDKKKVKAVVAKKVKAKAEKQQENN